MGLASCRSPWGRRAVHRSEPGARGGARLKDIGGGADSKILNEPHGGEIPSARGRTRTRCTTRRTARGRAPLGRLSGAALWLRRSAGPAWAARGASKQARPGWLQRRWSRRRRVRRRARAPPVRRRAPYGTGARGAGWGRASAWRQLGSRIDFGWRGRRRAAEARRRLRRRRGRSGRAGAGMASPALAAGASARAGTRASMAMAPPTWVWRSPQRMRRSRLASAARAAALDWARLRGAMVPLAWVERPPPRRRWSRLASAARAAALN
jgi:hypothetical protein